MITLPLPPSTDELLRRMPSGVMVTVLSDGKYQASAKHGDGSYNVAIDADAAIALRKVLLTVRR